MGKRWSQRSEKWINWGITNLAVRYMSGLLWENRQWCWLTEGRIIIHIANIKELLSVSHLFLRFDRFQWWNRTFKVLMYHEHIQRGLQAWTKHGPDIWCHSTNDSVPPISCMFRHWSENSEKQKVHQFCMLCGPSFNARPDLHRDSKHSLFILCCSMRWLSLWIGNVIYKRNIPGWARQKRHLEWPWRHKYHYDNLWCNWWRNRLRHWYLLDRYGPT